MNEIKANNPNLKSWVEVPTGSDFPIQNLPFGIFSISNAEKRIGVALGDSIIDLNELLQLGYFQGIELPTNVFKTEYLNDFISLGKAKTREVRERISDLFSSDNKELQSKNEHVGKILVSQEKATMHLPVKVGDYTDFYSSIEHATNVGIMFRDPANALLPNWRHLPVGYHGRASSIMVSGTDFHRPKGQTKADDAPTPSFGPTNQLDFELETGFITYKGKPIGDSISTSEAEDFIFGMVLFNDWSARDIQKWEYVPLGPFLAKNFASHVSPWIVTLDALEPYRVEGPKQEPEVLPYLQYQGKKNFDINLQVIIQPEKGEENVICKSNFKYMYWNMAQQLAHHTVNGCNINCGDMLASGTISGHETDSYGSMLELCWKGTKPLKLKDGSERKFIKDFDTVIIRGYCQNDRTRIGFGEVKAKVLPAK